MKLKLDSLPVYFLIVPVIVVATLVALFGMAFLDEIIYPIFQKVAFMNVPEKEYYVEFEGEPALIDLEPGTSITESEREEAKAQVEDDYKRLYGDKYKKRLRKDIESAKELLGDEAYEKTWGPILRKYEVVE